MNSIFIKSNQIGMVLPVSLYSKFTNMYSSFRISRNIIRCRCFHAGPTYKMKFVGNPLIRSANYTTVSKPQCEKQEYEVTFIKANGDRVKAKGKEGDSLLDVVVNNNLDFDGYGACEGTLTCSTCHVVLKKEDYDGLPEKPSDEELDMLDLAYDLTDTSRLGCQIQLTKKLNGLEVRVPATVNDAREN